MVLRNTELVKLFCDCERVVVFFLALALGLEFWFFGFETYKCLMDMFIFGSFFLFVFTASTPYFRLFGK